MVIVRFNRPSPPFMPGETAGFDAERAARYVEAGIAAYEPAETLSEQTTPAVAAVVVAEPPTTTAMRSPASKPGRRGR